MIETTGEGKSAVATPDGKSRKKKMFCILIVVAVTDMKQNSAHFITYVFMASLGLIMKMLCNHPCIFTKFFNWL